MEIVKSISKFNVTVRSMIWGSDGYIYSGGSSENYNDGGCIIDKIDPLTANIEDSLDLSSYLSYPSFWGTLTEGGIRSIKEYDGHLYIAFEHAELFKIDINTFSYVDNKLIVMPEEPDPYSESCYSDMIIHSGHAYITGNVHFTSVNEEDVLWGNVILKIDLSTLEVIDHLEINDILYNHLTYSDGYLFASSGSETFFLNKIDISNMNIVDNISWPVQSLPITSGNGYVYLRGYNDAGEGQIELSIINTNDLSRVEGLSVRSETINSLLYHRYNRLYIGFYGYIEEWDLSNNTLLNYGLFSETEIKCLLYIERLAHDAGAPPPM